MLFEIDDTALLLCQNLSLEPGRAREAVLTFPSALHWEPREFSQRQRDLDPRRDSFLHSQHIKWTCIQTIKLNTKTNMIWTIQQSALLAGPSPLVKITKRYLHSGIADIRKQTKGVRMWWQRKVKLKTDQMHQAMEKANNNFSYFFSQLFPFCSSSRNHFFYCSIKLRKEFMQVIGCQLKTNTM